MTKPVARFGVDWDDDYFICYDSLRTDALNIMHTGLSSDAGLVNLHWNYINKSVVNSATSVAFRQEATDYGIRQLRCVTGTTTNAGAYFGRTGSTNDFNVTNATVYTVSFWIKFDTAGIGMTFLMENSSGSQTFTSSTSWQRVDRTITTSGTTTSFKITKTNSASNITFDATGFMIVAGSIAPNGFNVGDASNLYDNITQDVKNCSYSIGKSNYTQTLFEEGKADLLLDNDSKRYSPEYASGPLFGKMDSRRRFTMDIADSAGDLVRRFTGWTIQYLPAFGLTRNREMTMICQQGKFLLDRIKYNRNTSGSTTADAVIRDIVLKGFPSAATPLQAVLNRGRLNACYFVDPDAIMSLETGVSTFDPTGAEEWLDVPVTRVLESVLTIDQGSLYINGAGKVIYFNREHYTDPSYGVTPTTINLDTEAVSAGYVSGANYANTIRVNYYPSTTRVATVWNSQAPIRLYGGSLKRKTVDVKFEYEEGKRINVTAVNPFDGSVDASTVTDETGADISDKVSATFEQKGSGGSLTLINIKPTQVHNVVVTIKGTITESYGGQSVTVVDENGLLSGRIQNTISSKLIDEEQTATNLADYRLSIDKQNVGQFTAIQMLNKTDAMLDKILSFELGTMLTLSETQTSHNDKDYAICGISESWRADNVLNTTYNLFPVFKLPSLWVLGTSVLGTNTYLAY